MSFTVKSVVFVQRTLSIFLLDKNVIAILKLRNAILSPAINSYCYRISGEAGNIINISSLFTQPIYIINTFFFVYCII
jgi:hypothetical protein